jgi:hypothetical protein
MRDHPLDLPRRVLADPVFTFEGAHIERPLPMGRFTFAATYMQQPITQQYRIAPVPVQNPDDLAVVPPGPPVVEEPPSPPDDSLPDPDSSIDPIQPSFDDHGRQSILDLVQALLDLVDADRLCPNPPDRTHAEMLRLIVPRLRELLMAEAEDLTDRVFNACESDLRALWTDDHPSPATEEWPNLAQARAAKRAKQFQRKADARSTNLRLNELRRERAAEISRAVAQQAEEEINATPLLDEEVTAEEFTCVIPPDLYVAYQAEVTKLLGPKNRRRFAECPLSLQFGFLLASHSRPTLEIARNIVPLPSYQTVCAYYEKRRAVVEASLANLDSIDSQVDVYRATLPDHAVVSLANDAMAMNPAKTSLPAADSEYMFVLYVQPLDRRYRCFPVHVMPHPSGRATEEVHDAIDRACEALTNRGLHVKFVCADGDQGYNHSHQAFFEQWYEQFLEGGLAAAAAFAGGQPKFPVGDYLHLWKTLCSKVKNHPVVLSPDCLASWVKVEELESLLHLGTVLTDKSSVGRMRDSYALKLFSLSNCIRCLDADAYNEFVYLLPFALQEEVVRNPDLSREDRLMRAILAFKFLMHLFDLSSLPPAEGVKQRFRSGETTAVTFAEDSGWSRILNSALALVVFTIEADEHWSFSRMGSHCLENFFGLVRRSSLGDDRAVTAMRIIVKATIVAEIMHDLGIDVHHRGRDNVGGVVISGSPPEWTEDLADAMCQAVFSLSDLEYFDAPAFGAMGKSGLLDVLRTWEEQDTHHLNDPVYNATFEGKNSNSRIPARMIPPNQGAPRGPARKPSRKSRIAESDEEVEFDEVESDEEFEPPPEMDEPPDVEERFLLEGPPEPEDEFPT